MLLAPLIPLVLIPLHGAAAARRTAELMTFVRIGSGSGAAWGVQKTIADGADVNAHFPDGRSLLHFAADRGDSSLVAALEKAGARKDGPTSSALDAMRRRIVRGAIKTCVANGCSAARAKVLLASGADINWRGSDGNTPLAVAVSNENVPMVKFLINNKANYRLKLKNHLTMIQLALRDGGNLATLNALKAVDAPSDPISELMIAVLRSNENDVEKWLRRGVPVDAKNANNDGWTSLMWAASAGDPVMTKLLLKHGANPNLKDDDGRTVLDIANENNGSTKSGIPSRRPDFKSTIQILKQAIKKKSTP